MKKLSLIAVVLLLALSALVLPAAAQDDLSSLASYFPGDAPLYAEFQTDEAIIETLDNLASKFGPLTPGGWTPGSLRDMLDTAASEIQPGGTFATVFRSWLGDSAAIGMYELREQTAENPVPPITIAIRITDQDQAETLFDSLPNAERYTLSEGDDYILYSPDGSMTSDPYFLFRDDVVLITGDEALVEAGGVLDESLVDNADFTTAVAALPGEGYEAVVYSDTPRLFAMTMKESGSMSRDSEQAMEMFSSLMAAVKPQVFALTLLDDRSLTLDAVSPLDADAASAFTLNTSMTPVDPSFLQHILANSALVVQGSNLYGSFQAALENLRAFAAAAPEGSGMDAQQLQTAIFGINFLVQGLSGMETDQALGWMTGNYAFSFGFSASFSDIADLTAPLTRMPFELGILIEATDADAAQELFAGMQESLGTFATDEFSVEDATLADGTDALNLTFTSEDMDFPVELQIATANGVFVIGTPRTVSAALDPSNEGLDSESGFVAASGYLLDDSNSIFYVSGSGLQPLANAMTASDNPQSLRQQGKQVQQVLDLIDSISISTAALADNAGSLTRFVWTLPE